MWRRIKLAVLCGALVWSVAVNPNSAPAVAQDTLNARTTARLNMRVGPDKGYISITVLPAGTGLFVEARSNLLSWLLVRTENNTFRGWVVNQYLTFAAGFNPAALPISSEIITANNPPSAPVMPPPAANPPNPEKPAVGSQTDRITLPANSAAMNQRLRAIYRRGRQLGNKPNVFIRLGDSITAYHLLHSFADRSKYDLGKYSYLQTTIDFFNQSRSLNTNNLTAATGHTMATVLDPTWADPQFCKGGENLLDCEIRIRKPSVALIYLGPNDMHSYPVRYFATNTDLVTQRLIDQGVIPVLYTFAVRGDRLPDVFPAYISVIRETAARKQIPLIDFHEVAKSLPDNGVVQDAFHMTHREDWSVRFTGDEHVYGETRLELLTLQMLDDIRRNAFR